jgi:putative lipoprotein
MTQRSRLVLSVLVATVIAVGCGGADPEPAVGPVEADAPPESAQSSAAGSRIMTGLCVVGHEVRTFIPCGTKKVYWIQADEKSFEALEVALERFTDEPFEPFSATLEGQLEENAGEGFAADYDGQVFVDRLIRLAPASELDCDQ